MAWVRLLRDRAHAAGVKATCWYAYLCVNCHRAVESRDREIVRRRVCVGCADLVENAQPESPLWFGSRSTRAVCDSDVQGRVLWGAHTRTARRAEDQLCLECVERATRIRGAWRRKRRGGGCRRAALGRLSALTHWPGGRLSLPRMWSLISRCCAVQNLATTRLLPGMHRAGRAAPHSGL